MEFLKLWKGFLGLDKLYEINNLVFGEAEGFYIRNSILCLIELFVIFMKASFEEA